MDKFKKVQNVVSQKHGVISVGDTVHIKCWYYGEGTTKFNDISNKVMVDVKAKVEKITIDETDNNRDIIWCGKFSTSSTDIANKGLVKD